MSNLNRNNFFDLEKYIFLDSFFTYAIFCNQKLLITVFRIKEVNQSCLMFSVHLVMDLVD